MIRSNEFNRSKFINNAFCFSQSFENALKKSSENTTAAALLHNNNDSANFWKTGINQPKLDVKLSSNGLASSSLASSKSLKPHICPNCQKRFAR